jgi:hypothetical protein
MGWREEVTYIDTGFKDGTQNDLLKYFQEDEVAIHHWDNNSVVRICDDGCIDSFASETIGVRIDPEGKSVSTFAPKINLFGSRINMLTKPNGLVWNKWQFNPALYQMCSSIPLRSWPSPRNFKLVCDYEVYDPEDGWSHVQTLIPPYLKDTTPENYSPEVKKIIQDLGLPL